jgi:hypothetical protein
VPCIRGAAIGAVSWAWYPGARIVPVVWVCSGLPLTFCLALQHAACGHNLGSAPTCFGQNGAFQQRMPGKLWDMHYRLSSALCLCGPCLCVHAAAATAGVSHFSPTRVSSCAVVRQSDSLRMLLACITHTWCSFWCALHDRAPSVGVPGSLHCGALCVSCVSLAGSRTGRGLLLGKPMCICCESEYTLGHSQLHSAVAD